MKALWLTVCLLLACGVSAQPATKPAPRPNVLVLLADDQGWGDLSLHGNADLSTPHIDSLARAGASFDRFYVQPVCSPTRAEFLTGRYHPRCGIRGVSTGDERLDLDERTVADAFTAAGYRTACLGKWHNGTQYPYHPNGRGFGEFYGFTSGHWGDYFSPPLDHNGRTVTGRGFLADDLTDRAIEFIQQRSDQPFFCFLAFNTPHSPMQVPEPYWARFKDKPLTQLRRGATAEAIQHTRAALAMCENLDHNVGRVLRALDERGLAGDTIVVYFSDNGPNGARWNGGMKGQKGTTDEGGVRSPLMVRFPRVIQPGAVVRPIAGAIDLLPTLSELAGVKHAGVKPLDGVSLAPLLRGERVDAPQRVLFQHRAGMVSARSATHRLDAAGKLYDMVADPGQTTDVRQRQPEVARELSDAVDRWRREVLGELGPRDDRPFPVGDKRFPITQLPARDGEAHGAIRRSAAAPNCSYFTGWDRPGDHITWGVEVLTSGRYRVEVLYACSQKNVGVTLELSLGETKLSGPVTVAHEPPARGAENDRAPRKESLVKDFKPWVLGEVRLEAGRGTLKLAAPAMPGGGAVEVRGLVLTLLE